MAQLASSFLRILVVAGLALPALAIWAQPRQADDWDITWLLFQAGSLPKFVEYMYFNWGGRVLPFTLGGLSMVHPLGTAAFKLMTVMLFLTFSACVHYLGTGTFEWRPKLGSWTWLHTAALLWLGLPVVNETVVWVNGAAGYLWPVTAGVALLCFFRRRRDEAQLASRKRSSAAACGLALVAGLLVGITHEQVIAGIGMVLLGWGWLLWRDKRLQHLAPEVKWALAGLVLGTIALIAAPGNYARWAHAPEPSAGKLSMLLHFSLYVSGAYFGLGTGDGGKALWLGIGLIALCGASAYDRLRGREAAVWLVASVGTLVPMLPLVNFAAPRTTFLAVTFLMIAALNAFPIRPASVARPASWILAFALSAVVAIDGLVGWLSNRSLGMEVARRDRIFEQARAEGRKEVLVPYYATIPSRITFMLNPRFDALYVPKIAQHYGLERARHDDSPDAPRPGTLNPLRTLRAF